MQSIATALVLAGKINDQQAQELLASEATNFNSGQVFVDSGLITSADLAQAIAVVTDTEYVDLYDTNIELSATQAVTASLCRRLKVLPIRRDPTRLLLAMLDPTDVLAIDEVSAMTGDFVVPVVVSKDALISFQNRYLRSDDELAYLSSTLNSVATKINDRELEDVTADDADAPIIRFVNLMISQAIQDRASDIHVEPGEKQLKIRFRIDGLLHEMQTAEAAIQDNVISRLKIMANMDIAEKRKPQDGRISFDHENRNVNLRVATLPTVWGEKIVMRILDSAESMLTIRELALSPSNFKRFTEALHKPYGMILVTGPTGSGKSTTLYATLNEIAKPHLNIITVEDPVEYRLDKISQIQVNQRAGVTFSTALSAILRSDPDVILVGEIRDLETAQIAVESALTGHLLLSTLHTNDAPSAITRLIDLGVEPFLVGSALEAVVAQRLARALCNRCKEPFTATDEIIAQLGIEDAYEAEIFKPRGCAQCSETGYFGRVAIHEVMPITEEIENASIKQLPASIIREIAVSEGMTGLREDGWRKIRQGRTSIEEVLRVTA
ncbi:MAG: Flp pilus assembly complex ATPase component TadA [Microbacteriaceae bacterium]|nr:Flp pilus assembly complex ATPase component TadA [Microbacteriaceae bacterium]